MEKTLEQIKNERYVVFRSKADGAINPKTEKPFVTVSHGRAIDDDIGQYGGFIVDWSDVEKEIAPRKAGVGPEQRDEKGRELPDVIHRYRPHLKVQIAKVTPESLAYWHCCGHTNWHYAEVDDRGAIVAPSKLVNKVSLADLKKPKEEPVAKKRAGRPQEYTDLQAQVKALIRAGSPWMTVRTTAEALREYVKEHGVSEEVPEEIEV